MGLMVSAIKPISKYWIPSAAATNYQTVYPKPGNGTNAFVGTSGFTLNKNKDSKIRDVL
jgi:hypothetical protein